MGRTLELGEDVGPLLAEFVEHFEGREGAGMGEVRKSKMENVGCEGRELTIRAAGLGLSVRQGVLNSG